MALRTTKLSSEIISNCNRLYASYTKLPISATLSFEPAQETIRYKISNTEKPRDLPEITFKKDIPVFQELQPGSQMEYQVFGKQAQWTEGTPDSPFPDKLKNSFLPSIKISDLQKAQEKMLKAKAINFTPISRSFSMTSDILCKKNEHANCEPKCVPKIKPCPPKKKNACKLKEECPHYGLHNCVQSKGSFCKQHYLDPECTKTQAPYPSYSELCAEEWPEDPSECTQCPWRSCHDADSIKVQPKKRSYSTVPDCVTGPLTKPPCKPPPSPCEVRREIEKKQKKERDPCDDNNNKKKKKGSEDELHQVPILDRQVGQSEAIYMNSAYNPQWPATGNTVDVPKTTWSYLERESGTAMEAKTNERKRNPKDMPPNCKVPIKPTKNKKPDISDVIEYGVPEWWVGRTKRKIIEVEDNEKSNTDCCGCPTYKFRTKETEMAMADTMQLQTKDKKPLKGDEGHPPPCPPPKPWPGMNDPCPKVPIKKPKFKKKPLKQAYYEEAYKDRDGK